MSETNEVQAECADGLAAASKSVTAADDPRLVQALEEYANAVEAGNRPNRKEFQDRYPDVAAALAECLEGLEFVQAAAPQLAHPAAGRPPRAAATAEFWPADPLGDFRIIAEIGRGGMGVVYEVMQVSLGRRVALKVLPFAAALDAKQLQRFKNEAQAAAQLHHQNIVPVYGLGCERGVHYYAMQYIDGQTLAALIGELRSLSGLGQPEALPVTLAAASLAADLVSGRWAPALHTDVASVERNSFRLESARLVAERNEFRSTKEIDSSTRPTITAETSKRQTAAVTENSTKSPAFFRTAASLAMQAATALEHAHALGVIHRDVKPANLLVDARGHLWITDFGLAHCQSQAGLTMTGDLMGTLRYMSPEQSLGQRVLLDHRTDIYSLGATLYELLTLEPVFDGRDRQELLRQIANDEPRRPRSLNHAIPVELETIVLKAMEKNPADRYATAQHMADDLQRYLKDEPIRARPPTLAEKTRKWMRRHSAVVRTALAMLSLSVVAVAVVATAAAWRLEREQKATSDQLYLTQQAEAEATLRLYRSLVEQARANRLTRRMGQRFKSLDLLAEATKHAHVMNLPDNDLLELRNEAVACLALTDVRGVGETWPFPTNGRGWVAYNPQQKRYACDQDGGSIAVYEVAGRQAAVAFHNLGPDAHCVDLRFSPDGRFLMANYRFHLRLDARVCVWKAHLAEAFQLILNEDANSAAFSPDGHSLAVGQTNGSIAIHSLAGGEVKRLEGSFHARNMAVHPGGGQLALSAWDGWHARLIDADTGRELATFAHDSEIHALDFSRDGRLLAVGCDDRKTYVWDVPQRRLQAVLEGHEKRVWSVAFSPRDELLATSARDGTTRFWDPVDGRPLVTAPGELLGFCEEGGGLAFRQGGRLGVWQIAHGAECRVLHHGRVGNRSPWLGHGGPESLAFHRGLPVLVSTAGDGARVWDAVACRELAHLGTGLTEAALFSPGGDRLYTYGRLGLQAWPIESDPSRPREVRIGPPDDIPVPIGAGGFRVNASEDGRLLAVSSHRDGHAYVLNAKRPSDGLTLADCPKIHSLAFSADGRWISAGVVDQGIKVWDAATGKLLKYFPGLRTFVTFSPDGQWLLGGGPVDYQLWRAGSWEPAEVFPRQHADYWAGPAALTRDSRLLALAANLQQAQLIDFASRRELATFPAEGVACVAALAFDPAGNRLAISGENHRIRLWDLRAVRRALHTLQLDWELADVGSDEPPSRVVPSITVEQLNFEAELLPFFAAGCDCFVQDMFPWGRNRWSNGYQLVCRGAAGNHVELEFTVGQAGYRQLALLSTRGPNAGIFQVALDGEDVGGPIDGFDGGFAPTVSLTVSRQHLDSGPHRLRCTLTGKNPKSGGHEMGIDAIRLTPVSDGRGS